jgi:hypothetical protein
VGEPLAQITVAQVGMGVDLDDDEVRVAAQERPDSADGQRVLAAENQRKLSLSQHALDQAVDLGERGLMVRRDRLVGKGRDAILPVGLAP